MTPVSSFVFFFFFFFPVDIPSSDHVSCAGNVAVATEMEQKKKKKTSFFGSSQETDECSRVSARPRRLLMFWALHLSLFPYISHFLFFFFSSLVMKSSSGAIIIDMFTEFSVYTLSSSYNQQHVLEGINTRTNVR